MQMLFVGVLCEFCGSPQCWILHDLQFVYAGRGCREVTIWKGDLRESLLDGGPCYEH